MMKLNFNLKHMTREMSERWMVFCVEFKGKRFEKNGTIRDKFEMFGAIERGEVSLHDLKAGKTKWKIIKHNYHVGSIHKERVS